MAKRLAPKPVQPVVSDGVEYAADGDGRDQYVVAKDLGSGKVLWRVKVFHNHINPWMETDVQEVYITDLKLSAGSLLVRDERSQCYLVDLKRRQVKIENCGAMFH